MRTIKIFEVGYFILFLVGCRKQPEIPQSIINEPENITTLTINFIDSANTGNVVQATWRDADGAGGNTPNMDDIVLKTSKTYFTNFTILDETKQPVTMVSDEINKEGIDHQFFYLFSNAQVKTVYNDADVNGNPIGLKSIWRTGTESNGLARIVLKHQPGVKVAKPGDITAGSSDIDITFNLIINN